MCSILYFTASVVVFYFIILKTHIILKISFFPSSNIVYAPNSLIGISTFILRKEVESPCSETIGTLTNIVGEIQDEKTSYAHR